MPRIKAYPMDYWNWLAVASGGALGATARYGMGLALAQRFEPFPWATLAVNILGSAALGLFFGLAQGRLDAAHPARLFFVVGVLGAFTTFSAFAGESADMLRDGRFGHAALHFVLHNALCLGASLAAYAGGARLAA